MPIYRALDDRGWSITTVIADDEGRAREEIARQLQLNPGRLYYYDRWLEGGRRVQRVDPEPGEA